MWPDTAVRKCLAMSLKRWLKSIDKPRWIDTRRRWNVSVVERSVQARHCNRHVFKVSLEISCFCFFDDWCRLKCCKEPWIWVLMFLTLFFIHPHRIVQINWRNLGWRCVRFCPDLRQHLHRSRICCQDNWQNTWTRTCSRLPWSRNISSLPRAPKHPSATWVLRGRRKVLLGFWENQWWSPPDTHPGECLLFRIRCRTNYQGNCVRFALFA